MFKDLSWHDEKINGTAWLLGVTYKKGRKMVLFSPFFSSCLVAALAFCLYLSKHVLNPGSLSWSVGFLQLCGLPSPVPTHDGWTPADPGLWFQWAEHRRQQQQTGSSSSTQREPGTLRTLASPVGWRPRSNTMNKLIQTRSFKFLALFNLGVTCATKGVMRAPTLAIPLLVPRPKALVAVG